MTWTLTVTLLFAWGMPDDRLTLPPGKSFDTVEECVAIGRLMVEWLTQDGVRVMFSCTEDTFYGTTKE